VADEQNDKKPQGLDDELRERQSERAAKDAAEREFAASFFGDVKKEVVREEDAAEAEARKALTEDLRREQEAQEAQEAETELQARRFLAGGGDANATQSVEVEARSLSVDGDSGDEDDEEPKEDPILPTTASGGGGMPCTRIRARKAAYARTC